MSPNMSRNLISILSLMLVVGCGPGSESRPVTGSVPHRDSNLLAATEVYGPLLVTEGQSDSEARVKPWSSWWFPVKDGFLFEGNDSLQAPLAKYDNYVRRAHRITSESVEYERKFLFDPNASTWEGLCNAWAIASLVEPEPKQAIRRAGIQFTVGDLKALLIKSYEEIEGLKQFGQRNNGDRDSVYEDVYPDQFHRVIQAELFERQHAFIMDKDPSLAVWNVPVWRAQVSVAKDLSDPHVMHVVTWLSGASPFVENYDFVGTLSVGFEYTYDLYGEYSANGVFHVSHGIWTGRSTDYHPDFLTVLPEGDLESPEHRSRNIELKTSVVEEIVRPSMAQ